jgi:methylated-DNA-[protein]-cysteine S-methyltransferase
VGALLAFDAVVAAPFGGIGIRIGEGKVIESVYLPASIKPQAPKNPLARETVRQLRAYLRDPGYVFDLPLAERGSEFQRRVWAQIAAIPPGRTLSYGDIARRIRSGPRAVGGACGANWFSMIIPCHRVLAANGIGGFGSSEEGGFHMGIKRWLLAHEGIAVDAAKGDT